MLHPYAVARRPPPSPRSVLKKMQCFRATRPVCWPVVLPPFAHLRQVHIGVVMMDDEVYHDQNASSARASASKRTPSRLALNAGRAGKKPPPRTCRLLVIFNLARRPRRTTGAACKKKRPAGRWSYFVGQGWVFAALDFFFGETPPKNAA